MRRRLAWYPTRTKADWPLRCLPYLLLLLTRLRRPRHLTVPRHLNSRNGNLRNGVECWSSMNFLTTLCTTFLATHFISFSEKEVSSACSPSVRPLPVHLRDRWTPGPWRLGLHFSGLKAATNGWIKRRFEINENRKKERKSNENRKPNKTTTKIKKNANPDVNPVPGWLGHQRPVCVWVAETSGQQFNANVE